jgi:predicted ATP-dependent endonuclease of OLD family
LAFAWKFTHASKGEFKNCILLLEEPGIHLHYSAQTDLLQVFERLKEANTILYTTHLASMVDLAFPERVRIVESDNGHAIVKQGVVSSQKAPMAVIEMCLGLTGDMSGLLGNRKTLIVEGGDDALILQKLSGMLSAHGREGLSEAIYLWPAMGATKTPMYAAFAIGQKWQSGVLLDNDEEGAKAREKIRELYLSKLAEADAKKFRVLMLGESAGIDKTDAAIEDLFPDSFYVGLVNKAYGLSIKMADLPADGSDMITKRVESVLRTRYGHSSLDKQRVVTELLKTFDGWNSLSDIPAETVERAERLFKKINALFTT